MFKNSSILDTILIMFILSFTSMYDMLTISF